MLCSAEPASEIRVPGSCERSIVPRHGIDLLPLDDGSGLLLDRPRRRVLSLNPTAAAIWCLLPDCGDVASLNEALAAATRAPVERCAVFVDAALASWTDLGLLDDGSPVQPLQGWTWPSARPRPLDDVFTTERHYALLGHVCAVRFMHENHAERVDLALAHLATPAGPAASRFEVSRQAGRIEIHLDGRFIAECESVDRLTGCLMALISRSTLLSNERLLNLHAAAIGGPQGCVLLPAASGSGKTTLTAALIHRGHHLLSDEVAPLCVERLAVRPFPLPLAIKEAGRGIVATMFPEVDGLPLEQREGLLPVVFMPPPQHALPAADAAYPVNAVIFPRFQPGAPCEVRSLGVPETLSRLFQQCGGLPPGFGRIALNRLVEFLGRLPCAELTFGTLDAAIPVIERLGRLARA